MKCPKKFAIFFCMKPCHPGQRFLYEGARAEHTAHFLLPHLLKGHIVLCDRFTDSTLAYQSHARGLPWKEVITLNDLATQGLKPDLTVFLDLNPEIGLRRATEETKFEREGLAFQKKVRAGFLRAKEMEPKRWLVLKMTEQTTPAEMEAAVVKAILSKLRKSLKI